MNKRRRMDACNICKKHTNLLNQICNECWEKNTPCEICNKTGYVIEIECTKVICKECIKKHKCDICEDELNTE